MQILSHNDKPDYAKTQSILENTIPIYFDARLLKEEYEISLTNKEESIIRLQQIRDQAIVDKINFLDKNTDRFNNQNNTEIKIGLTNLKQTKLNPNSPAQILEILLDVYDIPKGFLTDKGKLTTKTEVITKYNLKAKNPFITALLEYKTSTNTVKSITDVVNHSFPTNEVNKDDHQLLGIKPNWGTTVSSRFTTSKPNLQNLTASIKSMNCAKKGYKTVSIDIKQQEVIIFFSYVLKEPNILKALRRDTADYYMTIAKFCIARDCLLEVLSEHCNKYNNNQEEIIKANETKLLQQVTHKYLDQSIISLQHKKGRFGLEYEVNKKALYDFTDLVLVLSQGLKSKNRELIKQIDAKLKSWNDLVLEEAVYRFANKEIDKSQRNSYKTAILMTMYGAGVDSISEEVGYPVANSMKDMVTSSQSYLDREKEIKTLIKNKKLTVESAFGTKSYIEDKGYGYKFRCFFNRPTQTTGADLLAFTLVNLYKWKEENNITDDMIAVTYSIYDEINCHVREDLLHLVPTIKGFTEFKIADWSPLYSEVAIGDYNNG